MPASVHLSMLSFYFVKLVGIVAKVHIIVLLSLFFGRLPPYHRFSDEKEALGV